MLKDLVIAINLLLVCISGGFKEAAAEVELMLFVDVVIPHYASNREVRLDAFDVKAKHSEKLLNVLCDFEPLSPNFVAAIKRTHTEDRDNIPWTDRRALITVRGEDQYGKPFSVQKERIFYSGASEPVAHNIDTNGNPENMCVFTIDTPL